jgi:hypothetical protein
MYVYRYIYIHKIYIFNVVCVCVCVCARARARVRVRVGAMSGIGGLGERLHEYARIYIHVYMHHARIQKCHGETVWDA